MELVTINPAKLTEKERKLLFALEEKSKKVCKPIKVENGEIFKIGDIEFIKFSDIDGVTTAVTKDTVFDSEFGSNNNLAKSEIIEKLAEEFLPKIAEIVGEENILDITTDLTALDGVKTFGKMISKISLPTLDFYRENVEMFDKYKLDKWWWLATPWSAYPHYESSCILCVSPRGDIYGNGYGNYGGVRPFLRFSSSIFVSDEG